jgi:hypothetical protein
LTAKAPRVKPVDERVRILGIRHHGPGSARSVVAALDRLEPDLVLVEGPPDADAALEHVGAEGMEPPVALLDLRRGRHEPLRLLPVRGVLPGVAGAPLGEERDVEARFFDLPQAHRLAPVENGEKKPDDARRGLREDPLQLLAEAAGEEDGERWWSHLVEARREEDGDVFAAVLEAMTALREELDEDLEPREAQREAFMRKTLRAALRRDHERIAVVCGAWHAPALARLPPAKHDLEILRGLPKVRTRAAWVPWTHDRLAFSSGYGAGVASPEWYRTLWTRGERPITHWMVRVARVLREADLDASSAHAIEAVRLARTLAALRGRAVPDLEELLESTRAVFAQGAETPLRLVHRKLVVGERLGSVPESVPLVPLQQDLVRLQKSLRMKPAATEKALDLDLRKPLDRDRSHLLHRLGILGIPWGEAEEVTGKKGTFHEMWRLRWEPEYAVAIVEASRWGNTVESAATARAIDRGSGAEGLDELTAQLEAALLAELPDAVTHLTAALRTRAAITGSVPALLDALPPLARTLRYGSVREMDTAMIEEVVDGLVVRASIGLPDACASLDDEAATAMARRLVDANGAIAPLDAERHVAPWRVALQALLDRDGVHGLVVGRGARLLHDAGALAAEETARRLGLALSRAADPAEAAAWIEGLLAEGGPILVHDDALRGVLDDWVTTLAPERFTEALPLVRRTFATFAAPERREIGRRLRRRGKGTAERAAEVGFDEATAAKALPLVAALLGLEAPTEDET